MLQFTAPQHRVKGFTLLELLIALAVAGILAVLVAPSFSGFLIRQQLRSEINEVVTVLRFARSEAIKRNDSVKVEFFLGDIEEPEDMWRLNVSFSGTDIRRAKSSNPNINLKEQDDLIPQDVDFEFNELGAASSCECKFEIRHVNMDSYYLVTVRKSGKVETSKVAPDD